MFCHKTLVRDKWGRIRTFCSLSCAARFRVSFLTLTKYDKICEHCNINYETSKKKQRFCSKSCKALFHYHKKHIKNLVTGPFFPKTANDHPNNRYKRIYVNGVQTYEHRYIMEQHLKRKLQYWEHVHHINGNSKDNRLENLNVFSNSEHHRIHKLKDFSDLS